MALIGMPSLLSKRPWARIRARCEASFFIALSKRARCCSVKGCTYLTLIASKVVSHIGLVWSYRGRYYTKKLLAEHLEQCRLKAIGIAGLRQEFFGVLWTVLPPGAEVR